MPNRDPKQSASDALYVNDRTSTGRSGKPMTHQEPSNTLLMRSQMSSLPCSTKGIALSRDTAEPGNNMTRQKWPVANAERLTTMAAARDPSLRDLNELPTKIHQMARPNDQSGTSPNNSSLQPSTSISTGDISQIPPQTLPTESTNPLPEPLPTKESSNSGRGYRAAPNRRRYPPLRPC
ncbi:hypothetical protein SERLA73DRAFT_184416 [Serpula lacrymans var. lacrymans S7.3]|uniref:Uncharacterized protein n=1 Tax=Serpula lacrymans var. lacrymans (strain S7.3) TaxID=936435 RepID=F8Q367_SERL3|nr:hypothetical protein SERLA73DRAFT_184416 [Serpula lacrymans var. lacrymans S7.3]